MLIDQCDVMLIDQCDVMLMGKQARNVMRCTPISKYKEVYSYFLQLLLLNS